MKYEPGEYVTREGSRLVVVMGRDNWPLPTSYLVYDENCNVNPAQWYTEESVDSWGLRVYEDDKPLRSERRHRFEITLDVERFNYVLDALRKLYLDSKNNAVTLERALMVCGMAYSVIEGMSIFVTEDVINAKQEPSKDQKVR